MDEQIIRTLRGDDLRQPFRKVEMANKCASMLERVTGDKCIVVSDNRSHHYILRKSGSKVGRG